MLSSSKYANEADEPQTPTRRAKRQSVDSKPLPALPQSPADRTPGSHRYNASASSIAAGSPIKGRVGLDASSPKASAPSSPAVRRVKNTSTERFDWSDDDPKSPFQPDLSSLSPSKRDPEEVATPPSSRKLSMNPNAAIFTSPMKPSPTKSVRGEAATDGGLQAAPAITEPPPAPIAPAAEMASVIPATTAAPVAPTAEVASVTPAALAALAAPAPLAAQAVPLPPSRAASPVNGIDQQKAPTPPQAAPAVLHRPDMIARSESRLAPPPATVPGLAPTPDFIARSDTVTPTARGAKKILSQKGKPCIIRVPPGTAHSRPGWMPWTAAQTKARVDDFRKQGWDTRGFNHGAPKAGPGAAADDHAQARPMSSEAGLFSQSRKKKQQEPATVVFPDKSKWDDYCNFLIEEKLKGLGVIKAPTPPPEPSPLDYPNPLSRAASAHFPGLAASPPLPTSSAASQHMWGMPFSPEFSQGATSTVNTSLGALASPALSMGNQQALKAGQHANGFPFAFNPNQAGFVPQAWPNQHLLNGQDFTRGGSPAFNFPGAQRMDMGFQQQQQQQQPQQQPQQQQQSDNMFGSQQTPRPFEAGPSPFVPSMTSSSKASRSDTVQSQRPATPEDNTHILEDADRTPGARQESDYPDLAYPTPRGHSHRHNISANLEREVENPQFFPGEFAGAAKADVRGGPADFKFGGDKPAAPARAAGHQTGLSTASISSQSRLNVNAKEFKFDPAAAHGRQFSMSKNALLPASQAQPQVSMVTAHAHHKGSASSTTFNVSAPAFKPPEQSKFDFASVGFNFADAKESLENKPEPKPKEEAKEEPKDDAAADAAAAPRIFNHIEASDIVIPPKKSKAITIVNPALATPPTGTPTVASKAASDNEDESGRLGPDKARAKRGRFGGADGDDVPMFASPTPEPDLPPVILPSNAAASEIFGPKGQAQDQAQIQAQVQAHAQAPTPDLTEKLVDVSDNDWHEPDISTAWHEPEKKGHRLSPAALSVAEGSSIAARPKKEPRPVRGTYVPPHKRQSLPYPEDDTIKEGGVATPTFDQIDNVMGALNDDNSDFGIEEVSTTRGRRPTKPPVTEPRKTPSVTVGLAPLDPSKLACLGSQPSLSPRGISADWLRDQATRSSESPVRKINSIKEPQVSDWDDLLPASDDLPQAQFFDTRVKNLIEGVFRAQLSPLANQLKDVRASVTRMSRDQHDARLLSSHEKSSSDADDEDDIDVPPMPRAASRAPSRKADRKLEHIRNAVAEAVRNAQIGQNSHEALEREISLRHDAERRADDLKRLYDMSEQEIMLFKDTAENSSHKIRALEDTRKLSEERTAESDQRAVDLEQEIDALQGTLEEYRASSKKWRQEIDNAKNAREILSGTIEKMRNEAETERSSRDETASNLVQMQDALAEASANLSRERSAWQSRVEDQVKQNAVLETKLEEAMQTRTRHEEEIERLGLQEKLAIKSGMALEEARNANSKMEVDIAKLRADLQEHQSTASRLENDALDAQNSAKTEAERVKTLMEAEVEAANKRAENSRAELDAQIEILRAQLEGANASTEAAKQEHAGILETTKQEHAGILEITKQEHTGILETTKQEHSRLLETAKQEHTRLMEESFTAQTKTLEEAHKAAMSKVADQQARFEQQLSDLSAQHKREVQNAREDKERDQTHFSSSLKLAEGKAAHYLDKIKHLEDKVKVAQSAAEAAATAARSATVSSPPVAAAPLSVSFAPDMPTPHAVTERVSPQALRESIDVLQQQLQERETQIEQLESELAEADKEAPAKLRVAETEINWLREVLTVRVDDLTDLVNSLTMEKFDRGAARNAAIRIRANIEMEKQEKERIARGEPRTVPLPSLSDLQNFATPKAAQLAAAWGNWRKGGQSPMASMRGALASSSGVEETPSKKPSPAPVPRDMSSAQSFLSGLMTPPASNLRRTPSTGPASQRTVQPSAAAEPKLSYPFPQQRAEATSPTRPGSREHEEPPTTPRLLRQASYDDDAADARSINYPASDADESPRKGGPPLSMEQELAGYDDADDDDGNESLATGEDEVGVSQPAVENSPLGGSRWSS